MAIDKSFFCSTNPSLRSHVILLQESPAEYLEALANVKDLVLSQATKSRILVALHVCKQHDALDRVFLKTCDVVDIAKAVKILDVQRTIRQLEKKMDRIITAHPHVELKASPPKPSDLSHQGHKKAKGFGRRPVKRERKTAYSKLRTNVQRLKRQQQEFCGADDALLTSTPSQQQELNAAAATELMASASFTGALARKIRKWAKATLSKDFLEFVLLTMPLHHWKYLSDLVHFHPSDFSVPYFLSVVHGEAPPDDSFVSSMQKLQLSDNDELLHHHFESAVENHPQQIFLSYAFLRTNARLLSNPTIAQELARKIPLGTAIWYIEELAEASAHVPSLVADRLRCISSNDDTEKEREEDVSSKTMVSFGKLVERILLCQSRKWTLLAEELMPVAKNRLSFLQENWSGTSGAPSKATTLVLGDASASMQCAIESATILATMISVCFDGELSFFNGHPIPSPYAKPNTVHQTLEVCRNVRAGGCTSLAAALYPYYEARTVVERIFLVTDEEENTKYKGFYFAELLAAYQRDVYDGVRLVVISVGYGDSRFQKSLAQNNILYERIQIDGERADLTKFDNILHQLILLSSSNGELDDKTNEDDFVMLEKSEE